MELLGEVCAFLGQHGWAVRHVDCHGDLRGAEAGAVPRRHAPVAWPARIGLEPLEVNVKFTTNEGMGFVGRGEGIGALAVATVERA